MNSSRRLPITFSTPAGNQSYESAFQTAQAAEAAGFTSVTFGDRPHDAALDGWTLATAVAARTERIRFYHTTLNIPYRYPAVLAKEAATLDIVSGGRLDLCLGAGGEGNRALYDSFGVPLVGAGDRLQDLRDAIAILRGMWANEKFSFRGRVYHVEGAIGAPKPVQQPIPIWVGARLPRSLRLTGQIADGFIKNGGWGSVDELRDLNQQIDAAARKANRDPNSIRRVLNGAGFVAADSSELEAYRSGQTAAAGGLIGTREEVLATIRAYREAGVDTFNLRFPADSSLAQIERFGAQIVPQAQNL